MEVLGLGLSVRVSVRVRVPVLVRVRFGVRGTCSHRVPEPLRSTSSPPMGMMVVHREEMNECTYFMYLLGLGLGLRLGLGLGLGLGSHALTHSLTPSSMQTFFNNKKVLLSHPVFVS